MLAETHLNPRRNHKKYACAVGGAGEEVRSMLRKFDVLAVSRYHSYISFRSSYIRRCAMMKKMVLCSLLALGLIQCDCFGIKKSNSTDGFTRKKLIVYGNTSQETQRRYSDPVTPKEKSDVSHRISVDQFLSMDEIEAQQYNDVNFYNVKFDRACADKFWEVFNGMDNLLFENCSFVDGCKFTDIFDGEYRVACLSLANCNIELDDVDSILCLLYPYNIKRLNFQNNGLSGDAVRELMAKRLMSCAQSIDCVV